MKVLLVEDEEFIRDLFKRQLDLSGFTTDAFGNGQDGLAAISKNAYDLVLLDIMLPDINGLQILQNIRSNPNTKGVAVVLLTNLGQDAVIKQGFELGADGYLVKAAYTPDQIVQEVKNIMQKKQSQKPAPVAAPMPGATPPPPPAPTVADQAASTPAMPAFPGQAPAPTPDPMVNPTGQAPAPPADPLASLGSSSSPAPMPATPPAPDPMASPAPAMPDPMAAPAAPSAPADPLATVPPPPPAPPSASDITAAAAATDQSSAAPAPVTENTNS